MDLVNKERFFIKASRLNRVLIGVIFLIAGLSKMAEPYSFATQDSTLMKSLIGDSLGTVIWLQELV